MKCPSLGLALRASWDEAESWLKKSEHISSASNAAVLEELRRSGRDLLSALCASDDAAHASLLLKATRHAQRAKYDAVEALLLHYSAKIDRFKADYATIPLRDDLPDYVETFKASHEAQQLVTTTSIAQREQFHDRAAVLCGRLEASVATLDLVREELNKKVVARRRRRIASTVTLFVAAIGAGAALGAWLAPGAPPAPPPAEVAKSPTKN